MTESDRDDQADNDLTPAPAQPDAVLAAGDQVPGDEEAGLGGLDLSALLGAATEMQQQLADAQQAANDSEVEGVAGGGAVRITASGAGEFRSVTIDPSAVDPADVDMLQDLVLAALHEVTRQVGELQAQSLGSGMAGIGDLLGGGLGDLGSLFGSAE